MRNAEMINLKGRRLAYTYYYSCDYYNNCSYNYRWIYWAIPVAVVFLICLISSICICMRRRRARLQPQQFTVQPPNQPVPGYPTPPPAYTTPQYGNEYNNYNAVPPKAAATNNGYFTPAAIPQQETKPNVEMGYPQRY